MPWFCLLDFLLLPWLRRIISKYCSERCHNKLIKQAYSSKKENKPGTDNISAAHKGQNVCWKTPLRFWKDSISWKKIRLPKEWLIFKKQGRLRGMHIWTFAELPRCSARFTFTAIEPARKSIVLCCITRVM